MGPTPSGRLLPRARLPWMPVLGPSGSGHGWVGQRHAAAPPGALGFLSGCYRWTNTATVRAGMVNVPLAGLNTDFFTVVSVPYFCAGCSV